MIVLSKNEVTCLGNTFDEKQQKLYIFENLCKNRNIIVQADSENYTLSGLKDDNELELLLKLTDEI